MNLETESDDIARVGDPFDPAGFRKNAGIILDKIEQYLFDKSIRGLDLRNPIELTTMARALMADPRHSEFSFDAEKLEQLIDLYIKTGIQVHSPGYMGRQFSGIFPLSGVIDMVGSIVNQPASFYEAGQLPNVAERIMATEFNRFIGWPADRYDMVSTSGGSLANLTALLAARNIRYPDLWNLGYGGGMPKLRPALAISEDCHYSISRAAGIIGIGEKQIVRLPVDGRGRIDPGGVDAALDEAQGSGLDVFAVVASAGTTATGAIDPLRQIAEITQRRGLWLHVDGAHGACCLVSDGLRQKLDGIEMADSFILDAHKMLFVPSMCTLLFYRDKENAGTAFRQQASYVFEKEPDVYTRFDSAAKNFECTKRPTIMNLWAIWALYGPAVFAKKIEYLIDLTDQFYRYLSTQPDIQTIHEPELNIICFRCVPENLPANEISPLQDKIHKQLKKDGKFFISKVELNGVTALRVVFMNHLIKAEHYEELIAEVRRIALETFCERQSALNQVRSGE